MKNALWLLAFMPCIANAGSWFQFEAGLGVSTIADMGDGIWIQQGAPNNKEQKTTPAFLAGFTGPLYANRGFDLRWHVDYVYLGEFSASVEGVPDQYYDPAHHVVLPSWKQSGLAYSPFSGHGHLQGVPVTLDAGYTVNGWRLGLEAGGWTYWQTWHESLEGMGQSDQWHDLSHKTQMQFSYVIGANVTHKDFSLSYRYYKTTGGGNPYPGLATGAHVLMATYRF